MGEKQHQFGFGLLFLFSFFLCFEGLISLEVDKTAKDMIEKDEELHDIGNVVNIISPKRKTATVTLIAAAHCGLSVIMPFISFLPIPRHSRSFPTSS